MRGVALRPLAWILLARQKGETPDRIERESTRLRIEEMRDKARFRAEGRLVVLALMFLCVFLAVGGRMTLMAATDPEEPRSAVSAAGIVAQRADIVDRRGRILATNLDTYSLYAQPPQMLDTARAARELVRIFPELDAERLVRDFNGSRKFLWIKKKISPEQRQQVHDIGEPGLLFGPREMRLYPNGRLAAHVLGGYGFGREGVYAAEVIGTAGVERTFDEFLRDPAEQGRPLKLSLDLTVQAAVERVLRGGMQMMNAKGATAILLDVHSGEIIALASLPDFDPNNRPVPLLKGDQSDSPLFNRAVQGVYELGSTFKIFTVAQAMELGLVDVETKVDARAPLVWGRYKIEEWNNRNYGPKLPVRDVIVKSSNVGTANLVLMIGEERQREFFAGLGLLEPSPVELSEAPGSRPLVPENWSEIVSITTSYGHGMSASPLHLAAAYASIVNGGTVVTPTIVKRRTARTGARVVSPEVSAQITQLLGEVVREGTATMAEVSGYRVGGKTGTADKPRPGGGYYRDRVIATFASVFPSDDPEYVLIVSLDEPVETSGSKPRRTAGWTAAPVAAEIIRRAAPLLGLRPKVEIGHDDG